MPSFSEPDSPPPALAVARTFGEASFYVAGGTLPAAAPSYITRKADTDLYEYLRAGDFCYVLNTRQIGKSSLMIRTVRKLKTDGAAVVVLDLTAIGQNLSAEQWYDGLLVMLAEQLRLEDECEEFWLEHGNLGPLQRFFATVKEVVLPAIGDKTLIVFVDEIDSVRSLPFSADEFFAGIRECYNRRVQDPVYNRLTFCLLGVALPADLIQDTRVSPFNIGRRVTLRDFTQAEALPLAEGMGKGGRKLLERALFWTGGHPYLTQRLCREIARENCETPRDVDRITERLFLTKRVLDSDDNLSFVQNRLLRSEFPLADILDFYGKLRGGKRMKDDETNPLCGLLRLSGIAAVEESTDLLRLRNRIYETVFDGAWVRKNMPDAEVQRQKQAAWGAMMQVGSVAAAVIAVMGFLLVQIDHTARAANRAAQEAQRQTVRAEGQKRRAEANEKRANVAQEVARENAARAGRSERAAKRSETRARQSAVQEKQSANRARIGEAKAIASRKIADTERVRADASRTTAVIAKNKEAEQRTLAERRGREFQAQKLVAEKQTRLAERQTIAANVERARAENETAKTKVALGEASRARAVAENERFKADTQRKKAELAADKLSDNNRRRIERLKVEMAANPADAKPAAELAAAYFELASVYDYIDTVSKSRENYAEAAKAFSALLMRKPGDYQTLVQRGFSYTKIDRFDGAIADYSAAIALEPKQMGNYLNRARAYKSIGKYGDALQDLARVERAEPAQMDYLLRGQCLLEMRLYEQAVEAFGQVLRLRSANPSDEERKYAAEGHVYIGDTRRKQGAYKEAYAAYTRYQEFYPERENLYRIRIDCLLADGRWTDAVRDCGLFRQRFPDSGAVFPWQAYALLNLRNEAAYRVLCADAVAKFGGADATPQNANLAAWTCALGERGLSDYSAPIRAARSAIAAAQAQVDNGTADATDPLGTLWNNRNTLAALLLRAGDYKQALRELEACQKMPRVFSPDNHFSDRVLLVLAHAKRGERNEAARYLRLIRSTPPSADVETRVEQSLLLRVAIAAVEGN
ncbi:MAG: AAA-like domain-containing protein, partial [Armatimonadetes bacterium]|nr:AAA-like domain-containing protein [Armatimonadota bacterium]